LVQLRLAADKWRETEILQMSGPPPAPNGNPLKAQRDWPSVVITGAYQTGVVLMRDLARRGLSVCCVDCSPGQPGFRTVYGTTYLCPNPDQKPAEWLEFMVALAARLGNKPVLISSADQFVTAIAQHADALAEHFTFCHAAVATQALLATKKRQYELSEAHGLPVPRTQYVRSMEDVAAFGVVARFPCLLKPLHFRDWERFPAGHPLAGQKLVIVHSAEDLAAKYSLAAEASPELVAQEIIEGPDTAKLVYLSCYGSGSRLLGSCIVRQLRAWPIHFGSASIVEPVSDPEAEQLCDSFLRGIGYVGICEIELKRDSRDGQVKMIEANPRYTVTSDAAAHAGLELGWLHYLDLIGQPVVPVKPLSRMFRHVFLMRDSATLASYRREGLLSWRDLVKSYSPPLAFFDFDWRDRRVTTGHVVTVLKNLIAPSLRRIRRRKQI
jgi:D-aspartate ligase